MDSSELSKGINIFDKIVMELKKLKKFTEIKEVTFLYFDCSSLENLEILRNHPLTKNIIVVSDVKFSKDNVVTIGKEKWEENKSEFLEMTKNCIVINENKELALDETYSFLQMCSGYYPIVLIYSDEKLKKSEIKKHGFSSNISDNFYCNINVNLIDFTEYSTSNFEEIKKITKKKQKILNLDQDPMENLMNTKQEVNQKKFDNSSTDEEFQFLNGLKSPTVKNVLDKYNVPSSKKWRQEFYEYLKDLFTRIFPKDRHNLISKILTNETLNKNWIPCFTHFTANPNPGKNYEAIETLGDAVMTYCFKFYMTQKEPLIDQARLSNLTQKHMSKIFQSKVSKKMNLPAWLISCGINSDRMDSNEDLLEAFLGTIDQVLFDKSGKTGLGVIVVYNFMKLIFDNYKFETEKISNTDPDRTYVDQLFSGQVFRQPVKTPYTLLKRPKEIPEELWKKIVTDINKKYLEPAGINNIIIKRDTSDHPGIVNDSKVDKNGKVTITISILKEYAQRARQLGIDIPGEEIVIGQSSKAVKKIAEKEAYSQAKNYVVSKGMTKNWKENLKTKNKRMGLENIEKATEKAQKRFPEIKEITVDRTKTMKQNGVDFVVYQIIGEDKNGKKISVFTLPSQDKAYEQEVINEYILS